MLSSRVQLGLSSTVRLVWAARREGKALGLEGSTGEEGAVDSELRTQCHTVSRRRSPWEMGAVRVHCPSGADLRNFLSWVGNQQVSSKAGPGLLIGGLQSPRHQRPGRRVQGGWYLSGPALRPAGQTPRLWTRLHLNVTALPSPVGTLQRISQCLFPVFKRVES